MTPTEKEALKLLSEGLSKSEVARRCKVSRRTIIRWTQKPENRAAIQNGERLIEQADAAVAKLEIEQRINDLLKYRDGQRSLAVSTGEIASQLLPVCQQLITQLQQNPSELSPRMLPQLIKAISEVTKVSSDCWARCTGIDERIRAEVKNEVDDKSEASFLISQTYGDELLNQLIRQHFP